MGKEEAEFQSAAMARDAHSGAGYDRLKCDATALSDERQGRRAILLLNFNLPKAVLDDREGELPRRLQELVDFLKANFATGETLYYQMSGTYWLRHRLNGTRYRWVGSFFARDSAAASLTGPGFLEFAPDTFVTDSLQTLQPDNVYRAATVNFLDSAWHFEEYISVVVNFQCVLSVDHPFLLRHGLLQQRGARRKRRHVTLFPFAAL